MERSASHQIGFAAIARTTFDIGLATEMARAARLLLQAAGFNLSGAEALITTLEDTQAAAAELAVAPLDALVVLQATFADSSMVMALAETVPAPLFLWAMPEAFSGGRLRLNSLCGINLGGHALKRAGHTYEYIYATPDDPAAVEKIRTVAQAGRARRVLRGTRIGQVGEHPNGFETCRFDAGALQSKLGVDVVPVDLRQQVFAGARAADPQAVQAEMTMLAGRVSGLEALDQPATRGTLGAYTALRQLAEQQRLDGLAVRCWPEFFTELGCAACGAMSLLSDRGTPCSCEADVNGTITQVILQTLSGEPAFGTDIVALDAERDGLVLWHCGLAPLSMADPDARPGVTIHSNRKLPLLMEFPLKPGPVTIARLSEATGEYRLVVGTGVMQRAPRAFSGTTGVLRFERPAAAVLDTLLAEGLEHHLALTYGDHTQALLALAKMLQLPVLRL